MDTADLKKLPLAVRKQLVFETPEDKKPVTKIAKLMSLLNARSATSVNDIIIGFWTKHKTLVERTTVFSMLCAQRDKGIVTKTETGWMLTRATQNKATLDKASQADKPKRKYTKRKKVEAETDERNSAPLPAPVAPATVFVTPPLINGDGTNQANGADGVTPPADNVPQRHWWERV